MEEVGIMDGYKQFIYMLAYVFTNICKHLYILWSLLTPYVKTLNGTFI